MMRAQAAVIVALCVIAAPARAQERRSTVSIMPAGWSRWDAAGHVIWLGEHRPAGSFEWDRWFGVASGGGSVGYYWTPHLKSEFDLSTSSEGDTYSIELVPVMGSPTPLYLQRDHEIRFTTAAAGLTAQFFENAWFHPFVSAGMELVREREHVETLPPPVPPRGTTVAPTSASETRVSYGGRPYTSAGFKVYVSDRAFIRADVRTSWSTGGLAALGWRTGVGVDF
jgi:hypothetical protein